MRKTELHYKGDNLDVAYQVLSFRRFQQDTKGFTTQIKKTGRPLVLTVNGKARFVVQDAESYEQMLQLIDRLETIDGIRRGLDDIEHGRVRPAEEVFEEIRQKYKIPTTPPRI